MAQKKLNVLPIIRFKERLMDILSKYSKAQVGCLEAAYALLYGVSLGYLFYRLTMWGLSILKGIGTQDDNFITLQSFIVLLVLVAILQLSRTYHYVHEFDKNKENPSHFIFYVRGKHGFKDRVLRLIAGGWVIVAIKWHDLMGDMSQQIELGDPKFKSLFWLVVSLVGVFVILLLWDWNLSSWRNSENYKKMKDNNEYNPIETLHSYNSKAKYQQRIGGILFALTFILVIFKPNSYFAFFLSSGSFALFMFLWLREYGLSKVGILKFLKETFSCFITFYSLFFTTDYCEKESPTQ